MCLITTEKTVHDFFLYFTIIYSRHVSLMFELIIYMFTIIFKKL